MTTNKKLILGIILGAILLGGILIYTKNFESSLAVNLPPKTEYATQFDAYVAATERIKIVGGFFPISVAGTGSMNPYILPAKPGQDPLTTIVAYVVIDPAQTFESINNKKAQGKLIIYKADWSNGQSVIHVLAQLDSGGWILSGLGNAVSEPGWRVTKVNFIGVVDSTYVWK